MILISLLMSTEASSNGAIPAGVATVAYDISNVQSKFYACRHLHGFGGANWFECSRDSLPLKQAIAWLNQPTGGGIHFITERELLTPMQAWCRWLTGVRLTPTGLENPYKFGK